MKLAVFLSIDFFKPYHKLIVHAETAGKQLIIQVNANVCSRAPATAGKVFPNQPPGVSLSSVSQRLNLSQLKIVPCSQSFIKLSCTEEQPLTVTQTATQSPSLTSRDLDAAAAALQGLNFNVR